MHIARLLPIGGRSRRLIVPRILTAMHIRALKPQRRSRRNYRVFGGGFGFGTPVVSYAPRPIFIIDAVLLKVIKASWCLWVVMMLAVVLMKRSHWGCERILYIGKAAAMLTVTHQNRFWAVLRELSRC